MRGWSELLLLAGLLVAAWTRTPVGAVASGAVALAQGRQAPDLLASFRTALPPALEQSLGVALAAPPTAADPLSPSPALHTAVRAHLGEEALAQAIPLGLDQDPEAALERLALGEQTRDRAIRRARAAGEAQPERLASHRRFLAAAEARQADRMVEQTLALATVLDLSWPVDPQARVTSPFGHRQHPTLHTRKLHEGVDIAVPVGTPVRAAAAGRVARATEDAVNGRYVSVDHGHGVRTAYCHGEALHVERGQPVDRGQHVMDSGNTGRSTGPHLHFGLRIGGRPVDPGPFRGRGLAGS